VGFLSRRSSVSLVFEHREIAYAPVTLDIFRYGLLITKPLLLLINDLLSSRSHFNDGLLPILVSFHPYLEVKRISLSVLTILRGPFPPQFVVIQMLCTSDFSESRKA
jgi:hypothetical protein